MVREEVHLCEYTQVWRDQNYCDDLYSVCIHWKSDVTLTRQILKRMKAQLTLQSLWDDQQEQPHSLPEMGFKHAYKHQTPIWTDPYENRLWFAQRGTSINS